MPRRVVIVGRVAQTREAAGQAADMPGRVELAFDGGRSAQLDTSGERGHAWLAVLHALERAGLPAYVEVDPDTAVVTELLVPLVVRVGELRDVGEAIEVELVISQARHRLLKAAPEFSELLDRLRQARHDDVPVLVTETPDDHVIIDVRSLPEDVRPPPVPSPESATPASATPVSLTVANEMFTVVNGHTCCSSAPSGSCIPFTYPDDGCWGRAHEMRRLMELRGVRSDKVWIYGNLRVSSANKPDCVVRWGWHVAPTLPVTIGASTETYVIDPSLFPGPVPRATWAGVQGDPNAKLVPSGSEVFHRRYDGAVTLDPTYALTNQVLATYRAQLQLRAASSAGPPPYPQCQARPPGTQWFGTVGPHQTARWFTFGWPATWHVVWTIMPTSICVGAPQLRWTTAVERASNTQVTYWVTVTNLTPRTVRFEGRYDVLAT